MTKPRSGMLAVADCNTVQLDTMGGIRSLLTSTGIDTGPAAAGAVAVAVESCPLSICTASSLVSQRALRKRSGCTHAATKCLCMLDANWRRLSMGKYSPECAYISCSRRVKAASALSWHQPCRMGLSVHPRQWCDHVGHVDSAEVPTCSPIASGFQSVILYVFLSHCPRGPGEVHATLRLVGVPNMLGLHNAVRYKPCMSTHGCGYWGSMPLQTWPGVVLTPVRKRQNMLARWHIPAATGTISSTTGCSRNSRWSSRSGGHKSEL